MVGRSEELWSFWDDLVACEDDLPALLQLIVERVAAIVGEAAVLTVLSPDGAILEPAATYHPDPEVLAFMRDVLATRPYRIGEGIAGRVAQERRPAVLGDISPDTIAEFLQPQSRAFADRYPIHGVLIVPLIAAGQLVGTLGVVRTASAVPYRDEDLVAVEALAERAALAIAHSQRGPSALGAFEYEAIYRPSLDGVLFSAPDGRVLGANPAACEILGRSEAEICRVGRAGVLVDDDPATQAALEERSRTGRTRAEIPMRRGNGTVFTADVASTIFTTPDGELRACVIFRDISEQVALHAELRRQAEVLADESERDPLTQLRNRRGFAPAAEQALAIAARDRRPLQLLFFDVDNLKQVNDAEGHRAGDALLQRVAAAVADETRDADVSARLGGDEFALVLFAASNDDAALVVERITRALAGGTGADAPFSVGWAEFAPGSGESLEDLLHRADQAMYEAKVRRRFGSGPNSV